MALKAQHKNTVFGIGDTVKVNQKIKEGDKTRLQGFEGMVIGIKGRGENQSFTVRRIGVHKVGIEKIFPLMNPGLESIQVVRSGVSGVRRAKLYYIRDKSKKEVEKIYSRAKKKEVKSGKEKVSKFKKKVEKKKASKKTSKKK